MDENSPRRPETAYSLSKLVGEVCSAISKAGLQTLTPAVGHGPRVHAMGLDDEDRLPALLERDVPRGLRRIRDVAGRPEDPKVEVRGGLLLRFCACVWLLMPWSPLPVCSDTSTLGMCVFFPALLWKFPYLHIVRRVPRRSASPSNTRRRAITSSLLRIMCVRSHLLSYLRTSAKFSVNAFTTNRTRPCARQTQS